MGTVGAGDLTRSRAHALDQHIEIAHVAEEPADPRQLVAEPLDRSQGRLEGLEVRAGTAGGGPRARGCPRAPTRAGLSVLPRPPPAGPRAHTPRPHPPLAAPAHP